MMIAFNVPGNPVPWARATPLGGGRSRNPERQTGYKKSVAWCALKARRAAERKHAIEWPLDGLYALTVVVHRADWSVCDNDNLLKNVTDACKGVLYEDDRHKFIRDSRVVIGEPSVEPYAAVLVLTRDESRHAHEVALVERSIEDVINAGGYPW